MGKLTEFSIVLDSQDPVVSGQNLTGSVVVNLSDAMNMRAITIKLKGIGHCQWRETKETRQRTRINKRLRTRIKRKAIDFMGEETIIKSEKYLLGKSSSTLQKTKLAAGRHIYTFSFDLPEHLPSSFHGEHGYIRYFLKANIVKPWKVDHEVTDTVTIFDNIDPNSPGYQKVISGENHKKSGCLCCKTSVHMTASVERSCHFVGEPILINAMVTNQTKKDLNMLCATLIQVVTYKASQKKKKKMTVLTDIADVRSPIIPRGEGENWLNKPLIIPRTSPTIRNSKVLSIDYILKLHVQLLKGRDIVIKMPITLGSIPYARVNEHPGDGQGPSYPNADPGFFNLPSAPPPYSEVIDESHIRIECNEKSQIIQYKPNNAETYQETGNDTKAPLLPNEISQ